MINLLYLDPGTGYLIIQALVAAFASFVVFYKKFRVWLAGLFNNSKNKKS